MQIPLFLASPGIDALKNMCDEFSKKDLVLPDADVGHMQETALSMGHDGWTTKMFLHIGELY